MMPAETVSQPKKTEHKALWIVNDSTGRDVVAFCPSCKAMETLSILGNEIMLGRKFVQKDGAVFHTCGSNVPCRLYGLS